MIEMSAHENDLHETLIEDRAYSHQKAFYEIVQKRKDKEKAELYSQVVKNNKRVFLGAIAVVGFLYAVLQVCGYFVEGQKKETDQNYKYNTHVLIFMIELVLIFSFGLILQNNLGCIFKKKLFNKIVKNTTKILRFAILIYFGVFVVPQIKLVVQQSYGLRQHTWLQKSGINNQDKTGTDNIGKQDLQSNESLFNQVVCWVLWGIICFSIFALVLAYFLLPYLQFSVIVINEDVEQLIKHAHYLVKDFVHVVVTAVLAILQVTLVPPLFYIAALGYASFRLIWKGDVFIKLGGKTEYTDNSVQKDFDKAKNKLSKFK